MKYDVILCGVGGQGMLSVAAVIARASMDAGLQVRQSEVHGMAQRGGSVTAQLRYGKKVYSPLIEPGCVDIQMAFEMMEAVRYLPYLHKGSKVIVNTHRILPPSVATGNALYPENVLDHLFARDIVVVAVDAFELARAVGEVKTANVVMVGALSAFLPVDPAVFEEIIRTRVPERFREVNMQAFLAGRRVSQ